jgi:hypothetical protein
MNPDLPTSLSQRPRECGPFFDYVRQASREHARRERIRRTRLVLSERRLAEGGQSAAEQRWEGEGGSIGEGLKASASEPGCG